MNMSIRLVALIFLATCAVARAASVTDRVCDATDHCIYRTIEVPGVVTESQAAAMDKRMAEIEATINAGGGTEALYAEHEALAQVRTPLEAPGRARQLGDRAKIEGYKKKPTLTPNEIADYLGLLSKYVTLPSAAAAQGKPEASVGHNP